MGGFGDTGQGLIQPLEREGELVVFHAHEVEDGGLKILSGNRIGDRFIADGIGFAVGIAALDSSTGHPDGVATGVVVAAACFNIDESVSRPSFAEGFGAVDEGEVAISLYAAVAFGAFVDEDGSDVFVEGDLVTGVRCRHSKEHDRACEQYAFDACIKRVIHRWGQGCCLKA